MAVIKIVGPTHPYRGGIAHHTARLSEALAARHDVGVYNFTRLYPSLLFPGKTQFDESGTSIGVTSARTLDSLNPWTWLRTGRQVAKQRPERVVFQWWHPFFAPCYAGVSRTIRVSAPETRQVFVCHNVLPHESTVVDRTLIRLALSNADAFVVHARAEVEHLHELAPQRPVVVRPLPLWDVFKNQNVNREEARRRLGVSGDVVLFFGFVRAYKGLKYALEALPIVLKERPVTLVVAGEFYEDKAPYLDLVQRLGIEAHVRLFDRYIPNEEVAIYFEAADLVVQPYVTATQSAVSQIAFAFERPVVSTAVGGLPDVITEGQTGFLVPPEDATALAERIVRFFSEELGPSMREHVRAAQARFSWAALADAVASV